METINVPLNIPVGGSSASLPPITRPRRFARARAFVNGAAFGRQNSRRRRAASYVARKARAARDAVKRAPSAISQRFRRRRQASQAARMNGGRSSMRWGKKIVFFLVGALIGVGVQNLLMRLNLGPLACGIVVVLVGGAMVWMGGAGGAVRVIGAGMMVSGAAGVLVYEVRGAPLTGFGARQATTGQAAP